MRRALMRNRSKRNINRLGQDRLRTKRQAVYPKNKNGITVKVSDYGAIITAIETPDRYGKFADITLGFDKFEDYKKATILAR